MPKKAMRPVGSVVLGMGLNLHCKAGSHLIQAEVSVRIYYSLSSAYVAFAHGEEESELYEG